MYISNSDIISCIIWIFHIYLDRKCSPFYTRVCIFYRKFHIMEYHSDLAVWGNWDRGFESNSRHTRCICSVFVLPCVCSGLATGSSPVQEVLPTVSKSQISELINSEWTQTREPNPTRCDKSYRMIKVITLQWWTFLQLHTFSIE
jgi:hypothetical protein